LFANQYIENLIEAKNMNKNVLKSVKVVSGKPYDSSTAPKVWLFTGAPVETRDLFHTFNKRYPADRDQLKRCHWSKPRTAWYTHDYATVLLIKSLLANSGYSVELANS
jgi:hypothetical protein